MAREMEKERDMEHERDSARRATRGRGQAQARSSLSAVLDEVLERARDIGRGSSEFAGNVGATVRDNPVPIVLLAAGVASLVASERRGTARRAAGEGPLLSDRVREGLAQARDTGVRTLEDEPLLVAGIGLAVGAALGALLPLSQRERRTLGPARERVLEHARRVVNESAERVRDGAERVRERAERVRGLTEGGASNARGPGQASRRRETEDAETDERMES
jgi:hypothetical protein